MDAREMIDRYLDERMSHDEEQELSVTCVRAISPRNCKMSGN